MPRGPSPGLWMMKKSCREEEESMDDNDERIGEESRDDNDKGIGVCPEHTGTSRIVVSPYILSLGSISQKSVVSGSLLGPANVSPPLQVLFGVCGRKGKVVCASLDTCSNNLPVFQVSLWASETLRWPRHYSRAWRCGGRRRG